MSTDTPQDTNAKNKFRMAGIVAMALKRFQANMNPTYSYGKKPGSKGSPIATYVKKTNIGGRPSADNAQYRQHGHKGSILMRNLSGETNNTSG